MDEQFTVIVLRDQSHHGKCQKGVASPSILCGSFTLLEVTGSLGHFSGLTCAMCQLHRLHSCIVPQQSRLELEFMPKFYHTHQSCCILVHLVLARTNLMTVPKVTADIHRFPTVHMAVRKSVNISIILRYSRKILM